MDSFASYLLDLLEVMFWQYMKPVCYLANIEEFNLKTKQ